MDNLSLEDLEAMVALKKQESSKRIDPVEMTADEKIRSYCTELLKNKLYAPKS
ncbi:hypothetical protein KO506_06980 [Polaribacter vadi]|uniref:hypothetical protein n=1 Tax=Polaribacter TaxID=52959 RepID=UPI001C0A2F9F|nr:MULTISPECIES: hypothetical protein [Polaribacter]MBU3011140.1 hypothetical protein [Polaribacter vadi]MDO6740954.1 hypothetical protein [Polaribacter sp. 1_MG-2023]